MAHLFTDLKFEGGILGLAYVGSPRRNSVGGICTPEYFKNGYTLYLNSGLSSSRNHYGQRVITREADLIEEIAELQAALQAYKDDIAAMSILPEEMDDATVIIRELKEDSGKVFNRDVQVGLVNMDQSNKLVIFHDMDALKVIQTIRKNSEENKKEND